MRLTWKPPHCRFLVFTFKIKHNPFADRPYKQCAVVSIVCLCVERYHLITSTDFRHLRKSRHLIHVFPYQPKNNHEYFRTIAAYVSFVLIHDAPIARYENETRSASCIEFEFCLSSFAFNASSSNTIRHNAY